MFERVLEVSDGLIVLVSTSAELIINDNDAQVMNVSERGVDVLINDALLSLTAHMLNHVEKAEGTHLYFYQADPLTISSVYVGSITLDRDNFLKAKGAWEYYSRGFQGPTKGLPE